MPFALSNSPAAPGLTPAAASNHAATGAADPSGLSAFLAMLGPALAAAPADAAPAVVVVAEPQASALPVVPATPEPAQLAAAQEGPVRQALASSGKKLPVATDLSQLVPGLVLTQPAAALAGPAAAGSVVASGLAAVIGDAVRRPEPAQPSGGPIAADDNPLIMDPELDTEGAAANAYLDRFMTDPHRAPVTPIADIGIGAETDALAQAGVQADAIEPGDLALTPAGASHRATTTSPTAPPVIDAPSAGFRDSPGSAQWQRALDDQMLLMVNKGSQHARIRMHPEELGQLDIRIAVGSERVDLSFSVQHSAVAAAVNQHLPHLAQLFADQGLAMGQASVSHHNGQSGDRPDGGNSGGQAAKAAWSGQDEDITAPDGNWQTGRRGLFDAFA